MQSSKLKVFAEPALVGREQELTRLNQYLESAKSGKGLTVFISGEAGSGKTKLAEEFLNAAAKKGTTVLSGWCLSDAAVPYFPFVSAFDAYFSAIEDESLGSPVMGQGINLATTLAPSAPNTFGITAWLTGLKSPQLQQASSPQVWKDQLFSAVGKTLQTLAEQAPIIFFIEDVHWADSASLGLLHYISRIIVNEKIMLLATFRNEELTVDLDGHPHPLAELMRLMKREDIYSEIKLPGLSQQEITTIFSNMIGGNPQNSLVEKLSSESHGNALFLVESLRMLSERKSLIQEDNNWRLAEYEIGIPSKVKDIILRRLGILKFNQRRVLDAASVIGEKFDVELLSSLLSQDSLDLLETLSFISRSTSLVFAEGNYYRFNHAKSRETVYEEIPIPLKRGYHNRVAERLETSSKQKNLPLSDLAYHYIQADNKGKAIKFAMAAAEDEYARFSNNEAASHFKYVLENLPEVAEQKTNRLKAMEGLGDALYAMSLLEDAEKVFDNMLKLTEDPLVSLRVTRKGMICSYWLGNVQSAFAKGESADKYRSVDNLEYARLRLHRGFIKGRSGKNLEAIDDMEQALRVFERQPSYSDVAQALVEINFTYRLFGKLLNSFTCALRAVRLFTELEDFRGQGLAYSRLSGPFNDYGLFQEALNNLSTAIKIEEKVGDYNLLALHYWAVAQTYEFQRNWKEAIAQNLHAIEIAEKTDGFYVLSLCYAAIMGEYALVKDTEHVEEFDRKLAKLFEDKPNLKNNPNSVGARVMNNLRLIAAKGDLEKATQLMMNANKESNQGDYLQTMLTKKTTARLLAKTGKTEEAEKLRQEYERMWLEMTLPVDEASLQTAIMTPSQVDVREQFKIRIDLVTLKKSEKLVRIDNLIPTGVSAVNLPNGSSLKDGILEISQDLKPFTVEPIEIAVEITMPGSINFAPTIVFQENTENKEVKINPFTVEARLVTRLKTNEGVIAVPILPNRVSTGYPDLDAIMMGGIPENYSVILLSPSIDERELLIKRFLEAGAQAGQITYYLTSELNTGKALAEKYPQNFQLFACSSLADSVIKNSPNVYKLKGTENLTEIDIALTKALRQINPTNTNKKRICIEIISDVLLQHHALTTRKWLSGVLPMLKNKGFTVLAVINQQMHPPEESQAIQGLFDGEIGIVEKETNVGLQKTLRVRRLYNQKYLDNEITLDRDKLQ